ncbi:DUF805 domain-containing protein [Candidatus Daviesbacteria bacterium]|nr:DUF805 domain-containing protein [Candidatus Daviesbacteria bacterium]
MLNYVHDKNSFNIFNWLTTKRPFEGRIKRRNFVLLYLPFTILVIFLQTLAQPEIAQNLSDQIAIILLIVLIATVGFGLLYMLPLLVRRLHDLNHSGWALLLMFVPFINLGLILILLFVRGTEGENKYGKEPPDNRSPLDDLFNRRGG